MGWAIRRACFDVDDRLRRLSEIGDQLEAYATAVDFEIFRPDLIKALAFSDGAKGGRPTFDPVLMFKILIVQAQHNLSDDRAEFLINDRLSVMRFLGLGLTDKVPDAKTIWAFRERLIRARAIKALFARFDHVIREAGYIPMSGQIVDASLVSAPKQRNTESEKQDIKAGRVPEDWQDKPAKLRQKDRDARWTVQFGKARAREDGKPQLDIAIPTFGYKTHTSIDRRYRFIRKWDVTDASRHDGRMLRRGLLDKTNTGSAVWATSRQLHSNHLPANGQRLSLQAERAVHGEERLHLQGPSPQTQGQADAGAYPARQRHTLKAQSAH